jgi:hypothetical protein
MEIILLFCLRCCQLSTIWQLSHVATKSWWLLTLKYNRLVSSLHSIGLDRKRTLPRAVPSLLCAPVAKQWLTRQTHTVFKYCSARGRSSSVGSVSKIRSTLLRFDSQQEQAIFFSTASRPAVGPTQTHIQRVPGALSAEWSRVCKSDHSLVPRLRSVSLFPHSQPRFNGVAFN